MPDLDLTVEQPAPIPTEARSIQSLVRDDLIVRERIGIDRYGSPLQAHNGRDALRDAYEEAVDLACYLRQLIAERGTPVVLTEPSAEMVTAAAEALEEEAIARIGRDLGTLHRDTIVHAALTAALTIPGRDYRLIPR